MDYINETLRVVLAVLFFLQGVIVLVTSLFVAFVAYRDGDDRLKHIVAVALAHAIFTGLAISGYFFGRYEFFSVRGFLIFLAFTLTDYGLIQIFLKSYSKLRDR